MMPAFLCLDIDLFCQPVCINRMNQGNLSDNIFDLVALQMADHVPADVGRELLHFIAQFLHFIFSEIADALPRRFPAAFPKVLFC